MSDDNKLPAVYVNVKVQRYDGNTNFSDKDLYAIKDKLEIKQGDAMDFNSYREVAKVVAEHFKLDDVTKSLDNFYDWMAGTQITIHSIIIFWMCVLMGYKDDA